MNRITQIILLLALLLPATAYAHDFVVNGIYYNINGNEATVTSCPFPNKYSGSVTIPATVTYNGTTYSVTTIGQQAFSDCIGLTSITIPNSVTEIGPQAFLRCTGLTSITIPNSVTYINYGAFYDCSGLTSITIPNSVTAIGQQAFMSCTGLTSITIPNSVTAIGNEAFYGCSGLTRVNISDIAAWCNIEFEAVNSTPLYYCGHLYLNGSAITKLTIPNSVTNIKNFAFYNCTDLTRVNIPNSVTTIGLNAFGKCSGLTNVTIPNSVTYIGESAFSYCTSLTNIDIPNSVTTIEWAAFCECTRLTSINIPNSVTTIGGIAFAGTAWYNNQPDGLIYAGLVAYEYKGTMPSGTSITLRDGTLGIAGWAFDHCTGLTNVTIPNSVTYINYGAFYGCSGLTEIYSLALIPPTVDYSNSFSGCNGATLYVPKQAVNAYKAANYWKDFTNIIGIDDEPGDVNGDGGINISDVTSLINLLLIAGEISAGEISAGADVNGDGQVNISDVTALINRLLSGN